MTIVEFTVVLYVIWNIVNFGLMGIDKYKARRNHWRIPESTLLGGAFLMGAAGSILGSRVFRHKTQKTKFRIGLPAALLFNIAVAAGIWYIAVNVG